MIIWGNNLSENGLKRHNKAETLMELEKNWRKMNIEFTNTTVILDLSQLPEKFH